jgi:3-deoxy-D-manno-octulosonic-acid transferase
MFVQNQFSKDLLAEHGIMNTTVVGDTRLDRVIAIRNAAAPLPIVEQFAENSPCFIAGSSWGPDEEIYIPYFARHKDWRLIIAPHVISETHLREIEKLLAENGYKSVRYTELENKPDILSALKNDTEEKGLALIVNCFGKLSSIYRYGKVALVGGGFGVGIHNVPEAAVYGIPVLFGPNNKKFREAQALKACEGSFEYQDEQTFASIMDRFIHSPEALQQAGRAAGNYINSNAGATEKCFNDIFN